MNPKSTELFLPWVKRPLILALVSLVFVFFTAPLRQSPSLANLGLLVFAFVTLYFLVQAIDRFRNRQYKSGGWAAIRLLLCGIVLVPMALFLGFATMMGPAYDDFARDLTLPANIEVTEPSTAALSPADESSKKSLLHLSKGFQPGIYGVQAWFNPGEPGIVHLRAYEVTRNTPLSSGSLSKTSSEPSRWSTNSQQLFFYNHEITIYEGDWGQHYAARFELWFKPQAGSAERKLLERTFKIEGWQR